MSEKIVFTVVKDEAPFLLEWIAFYRMIGFDTVVIYSNNSTDRTDELCAAMAAEGLIEHHIHQPEGRSPQGHAAWLFRRSGAGKAGGLGFVLRPRRVPEREVRRASRG